MKKLLFSAVCGVLALGTVNLIGEFSGVFLPVSRLSLGISALLGIPGVISMLVLKMIM